MKRKANNNNEEKASNKVIKKELTLDKHQVEAVNAIEESFEDYDRCLVKMFCGKATILV